jgi:tRNA uridine 5-carboxymethylaminomethyl modification enzyme
MMTSRSEYRLYLRQDNADARLSEIGYNLGLISEERMEHVREKYANVEREIKRLEKTFISPSEKVNEFLTSRGLTTITTGTSLASLIRRPQLTYKDISELDEGRPDYDRDVAQEVEIELKYAGYIEKQMRHVKEFRRMESKKLPEDINYDDVQGLRLEARQKLQAIRPENLGQASRISGVSPADTAALMIYLSTK